MMITDKQFEDAFTAAGGWFLLTQFEKIHNWTGNKSELVDELFKEGFDAKRTGTNARVSSVIRIIEANRGKEALIKIRDSKVINKAHPDAQERANELIKVYYSDL
ncbi:MAG: hypothetical protein IKW30_02835 [Lachnospiraceae bacterium]|nr:hypothetical protein [Lachnospiraceae bacterium]